MKNIITASEARILTEKSNTIFEKIKRAANSGGDSIKLKINSSQEAKNLKNNLKELGYNVTRTKEGRFREPVTYILHISW